MNSSTTVVFRPRGDLELEQLAALRAEVRTALDAGASHLVFNLADVTFMDSRVLGLLATTSRRCRRAGGTVRVTQESALVTRAIRLTGLASLLGPDAVPGWLAPC